MKLILRLLQLLVFLSAITLVAILSHSEIHKVNRISDGRYETVYYDVLGWRLPAITYYTVAVVTSLIVVIGTIRIWRIWRSEIHHSNSLPA